MTSKYHVACKLAPHLSVSRCTLQTLLHGNYNDVSCSCGGDNADVGGDGDGDDDVGNDDDDVDDADDGDAGGDEDDDASDDGDDDDNGDVGDRGTPTYATELSQLWLCAPYTLVRNTLNNGLTIPN